MSEIKQNGFNTINIGGNYKGGNYSKTIQPRNYKNYEVENSINRTSAVTEDYSFDNEIQPNFLSKEEIEKIANDVINGKYGHGENRVNN